MRSQVIPFVQQFTLVAHFVRQMFAPVYDLDADGNIIRGDRGGTSDRGGGKGGDGGTNGVRGTFWRFFLGGGLRGGRWGSVSLLDIVCRPVCGPH